MPNSATFRPGSPYGSSIRASSGEEISIALPSLMTMRIGSASAPIPAMLPSIIRTPFAVPSTGAR